MNIRDVARLYDIRVVLNLDPSEKTWVCPFPQHPHNEYTPSLGVTDFDDGRQRFTCFGTCGAQGDVIDAVGYISIPNYQPHNREHVNTALGLLQSGWEPCEPRPVEKAAALGWDAYENLDYPGDRVVEYAKGRGLAMDTLHRWGIRDRSGAMAIPVFHFGTLVALKYRATWPNPKLRYWSEPGSKKGLFGYADVYLTDRPVLVVKGEIAAMLASQFGFLACAPTSGEDNDAAEFKYALGFSPKVVVVGDNDASPETRRKMQAAAARRAEVLGAELRFPPDHIKDIDLWLLQEPQMAAASIREWLE